MKCPKCDSEITESGICPNCKEVLVKDSDSFWWLIFGLFLPIVAVVLYIIWRTKKPMCSKKLIIGAIISLCVLVLAYFVIVLLAVISGGNIFS